MHVDKELTKKKKKKKKKKRLEYTQPTRKKTKSYRPKTGTRASDTSPHITIIDHSTESADEVGCLKFYTLLELIVIYAEIKVLFRTQ